MRLGKQKDRAASSAPDLLKKPQGTSTAALALPAEPPISTICKALLAALEHQEIRYCHWKSNVRLDRTLAGREDIDLLVHPTDATRFQEVLNGCDFKLAVAPWGAGHPGVFHAVAWDAELGRLLDLHAYHHLVSGDSFVKSYHLPVEDLLLQRASLLHGVKVPEPAAELMLFLLRVLLKHVSPIELYKVRKGFAETREELDWLLARTELAAADLWCEEALPSVDLSAQSMSDCIRCGSVAARIGMGVQVAWALRRQRRLGHIAAFGSRVIRVARHFVVRARSRRNLALLSGGAWMALVGPKGSGKSTLGEVLAHQLGTNLDVKRVHLGKPPPGLLTFIPALLRRPLRAMLPGERLQVYEQSARRSERRFSNAFVLRKLLLAIDRERLLTRSMRAVASGAIVISDRCPAANATGLDGSAFDDLAMDRARSPLQRWMMEWEREIYRRLPRPRLVLKLAVPLATALQRDQSRTKTGGPDPEAVRRRYALESGAEFSGSAVRVIGGEGDLETTARQAMACIWQAL